MPKTIKGLPATVFLRWLGLVVAFWFGSLGGAAAIFLDHFYVGVALLSVSTVVWLIYGPFYERHGLRHPTRAEAKAYRASRQSPKA